MNLIYRCCKRNKGTWLKAQQYDYICIVNNISDRKYMYYFGYNIIKFRYIVLFRTIIKIYNFIINYDYIHIYIYKHMKDT